MARHWTAMRGVLTVVLLATAIACGQSGRGDANAPQEIVVSNYGVTVNGMPFAVAEALGYFEDEGAAVSGILSSSGGGSTVRNLLGGNLAYAETSLASAVAAAASGADLKIVSGNAHTVAEFYWLVMPDSPIVDLEDIEGKTLGFTNPRSTSQALNTLLLRRLGLDPDDVGAVNTGGFGPMLVALEQGAVDVAPVADPMYTQNKDKYRVLVAATDVLPALTNVVGVTAVDAANTRGDFIRAVIRARRRAVDFIYANPEEAAILIAPEYGLDVAVTQEILENLIAGGQASGTHYWGPGNIVYEPMDAMIAAQRDVGAIAGAGRIDWTQLVDERFLPDDLRDE